jgi:3-methyladenine DNA glycosylase AlkD
MTLKKTLAELKKLGSDKVRDQNAKHGAPKEQFGCKLGDVKKLAKQLKTNHDLALELWETGNVEAQMLATLVCKPKQMTPDDLDAWVRTTAWDRVADWFNAYVVKKHPDAGALRERWMKPKEKNPWAQRAGWSLAWTSVGKNAEGLDLKKLLDRIEKELGKAKPEAQWTMNFTLAEIGINHAKFRKRAVAIGEKHGYLRDYGVSKGCVSPFAPVWIAEMVKRQG